MFFNLLCLELDFKKFEGMTPYFNVAVVTFGAFLTGLFCVAGMQLGVEKLYEKKAEKGLSLIHI